jgi:pimeloyl-ACP methyl ester carboxylesterase
LPAGGFSIADLADDVAALLTALGFEKAGVSGLSMGGYVALAFAQRHRARLSELLLCDTKAAPDSPEARRGREDAIAQVQKEGVAALRDKQIPRLLAPAASEALRAEVRGLATDRAEGVIAAIRALRDRPDRRAELSQIACPTLVVVGSDDVLSTPAEAREMADQIPGARLAEIPNAGHLSNLDNPAAFSRAVLEFLTR